MTPGEALREKLAVAVFPDDLFGENCYLIRRRDTTGALVVDPGLQVHERPFLSPTDHTPLRAGMVITNEPGIYIPGWGGVRLEEMVLITETSPEVLTAASWEIGVG